MTYIILNKANKIVAEKTTPEEAEAYTQARPYLKYQKFELKENDDVCDLDDIL